MRDKEGGKIFENYGNYKEEQQLNEFAAIAAQAGKFLPQILNFIKSNPELAAQLAAAIPGIASLVTGGDEEGTAPAAAPAAAAPAAAVPAAPAAAAPAAPAPAAPVQGAVPGAPAAPAAPGTPKKGVVS